jgi:hypothetical protein
MKSLPRKDSWIIHAVKRGSELLKANPADRVRGRKISATYCIMVIH